MLQDTKRSSLGAEHLKHSHTYRSEHKVVEAHPTRMQAQGVRPRRDRGPGKGSMRARHGGLIEVSGPRVTPRRSAKKRKGKASTVAQKASIKSRVYWNR